MQSSQKKKELKELNYRYQITSQEYINKTNIIFGIKDITTGHIHKIPIHTLFYEDHWLAGFTIKDIRIIAKVATELEWLREREQLKEYQSLE